MDLNAILIVIITVIIFVIYVLIKEKNEFSNELKRIKRVNEDLNKECDKLERKYATYSKNEFSITRIDRYYKDSKIIEEVVKTFSHYFYDEEVEVLESKNIFEYINSEIIVTSFFKDKKGEYSEPEFDDFKHKFKSEKELASGWFDENCYDCTKSYTIKVNDYPLDAVVKSLSLNPIENLFVRSICELFSDEKTKIKLCIEDDRIFIYLINDPKDWLNEPLNDSMREKISDKLDDLLIELENGDDNSNEELL